MKQLLTMPFIFHSQTNIYLLELGQDGVLSSTRFNLADENIKRTEVLVNCARFCAAVNNSEQLYILTANQQNELLSFLLADDEIEQLPFFTNAAPSAFTLAFDSTGLGYYCAESKDGLTFALLNETMQWQTYDIPGGQQSAPLAMAIDQAAYLHLLLFDRAEKMLYYQSLEPKTYRPTKPFYLATNYTLITRPAFLFDSFQNLHLAWQEDDLLHYQARLAGGWPSGGWQHKVTLPLQFSVQLMSFIEAYPQPQLWLMDEDKLVHYYNPLEETEISCSSSAEILIPARFAPTTSQQIRLIKQSEETSLLVNVVKTLQEDKQVQTSRKEEEESPLFLHARRLMAEKKRLEYELSKKEASLAQLRHMLELAQENLRRNSISVNEKLYEINQRSKE
ncbi:MAG TPA: hypothetical protein VFC74_03440, partial [Oscillospiraceae bacterium]|nr:hypothetical protein [Oscillospiraceae bacterium]